MRGLVFGLPIALVLWVVMVGVAALMFAVLS